MSESTEVRPRLLVLVGPTAVGKTKWSLPVAEKLNCEIISGDSMQVYRGMDIGTAKASSGQQAKVPHHLIDIRDPKEAFSAAEFQAAAKAAIRKIAARGKLPFLVGGTGMYIESLCYGYQFGKGGTDEIYRAQLKEYAQKHGDPSLHEMLVKVDPVSAARLHPNDIRRIIRALEIAHVTGISMTDHLGRQSRESPYELCLIGLTMPRDLLYKRIEARVDEMITQGLVEEVRGLIKGGCAREMISMQGLGYKEIAGFIQGDYSLPQAVALLKRNTRRFAKRQLSWFRHMNDIQWVKLEQEEHFSTHLQTIHDIIARKFISSRECT